MHTGRHLPMANCCDDRDSIYFCDEGSTATLRQVV
jgi:hypothetical protein